MLKILLPLKKLALVIGDLGAFSLALVSGLLLRHGHLPPADVVRLYLFALPFLLALWTLGFLVFGLYDLRLAKNDPAFFERLGKALIFNLLATAFLFYLVREFRISPIVTLGIIFGAEIVILGLWRSSYNRWLRRARRERVLFIGAGEEVFEIAAFLQNHPQLGLEPALALSDGDFAEQKALEVRPLAGADIGQLIVRHGIAEVVVSTNIKGNAAVVRSLVAAVPSGLTVTDLPRFYETVAGIIPVSTLGEIWFLEHLIGQPRPRYEFAKRILDLTLAAALLLPLAVLLPVVALGIVLSTPRDIFDFRRARARAGDGLFVFRQERVGRGGEHFRFLKFRSQRLGAERMNQEKGEGADPRAYPFGTMLRRTYLDELLQIWNVIKGEMSFVGPRPERPELARELARRIPFYRMRELVLPGITGWAQINMENDASVSDAPEKIRYDLFYIKNRSLALDLLIMVKTALALMRRSGR